MDHRSRELGDFLRTRRARVRPEQLGLPGGGRRRAAGLRREEVAAAAGVSVDYYSRLEQGRGNQPSASVLAALGRTLGLTADEQTHLLLLGAAPAPLRPPGADRVLPGTARLLQLLEPAPAVLFGRRMDVLAWNPAGSALFGGLDRVPAARRNIVWMVFLDPATQALYSEWDEVAAECVAHLRAAAAHHPGDPGLTALVGELSVKSERFRSWWAAHDVREKTRGRKRFNHPLIGPLTLDWQTLAVVDALEQKVVVYTAEPASASERALELLQVVGTQDMARPDSVVSPAPASAPAGSDADHTRREER